MNYGLIIPKIETREEGAGYILGSSGLSSPIINPSGDWTSYLPDKEAQNVSGVETNACTIYATLNAIETLIFFKTGIRVDYSNRYLANVAKKYGKLNPSVGADPHSIAELIRTIAGCLKEDRLPDWTDEIKTKDDYYALQELTDLIKEGERWYDEWDLKHEWLWSGTLPQIEKKRLLAMALQRGTVCVSVSAWYDNNGVYYKPQGSKDNHWTMDTKIDGDGRFVIFDSYADGEGDPYLKTLTSDFDFAIAKIYYLEPASVKLSILQKILDLIGRILSIDALLIKRLQDPPIDQPPPPPATPPKPIETIEQMCRRVCLEEGLTGELTNQLLGTIACESNFNPKAIHINKDKNGKTLSTDYGIIQANDYWFIGKGKPIPSIEVAMNQPEFCVRVMARMFKLGKAYLWNCWKKLYSNLGGITSEGEIKQAVAEYMSLYS